MVDMLRPTLEDDKASCGSGSYAFSLRWDLPRFLLVGQGRELVQVEGHFLLEPTFKKWKIAEGICRDAQTDFIR